jgi:RNA polymerase sigma factor (sigma-70 family)
MVGGERPNLTAGETARRNHMATKKDSFSNDATKNHGLVLESEISFYTKSGSSPTTSNESNGRPFESGHLVNEAYDRYRLSLNAPDALNDLLLEIRNYADRILSKECTFKGWTSVGLNADDIAQKALLNIWKGLKTFRSESKFSTWCYRIIRRAASDTTRRIPQGEVELLPWKEYGADYCGTAHGGCTGSAPGSGKAKDPFAEHLLNCPYRKKDDGDGRGFVAKPLLPKRFLEQEEDRLITDVDFQSILEGGLNTIDSQIGELAFVFGYAALEIAEKLGKDTTRMGHNCSPGERWVQNRIAAIRKVVRVFWLSRSMAA